jgi:hypothetical protein
MDAPHPQVDALVYVLSSALREIWLTSNEALGKGEAEQEKALAKIADLSTLTKPIPRLIVMYERLAHEPLLRENLKRYDEKWPARPPYEGLLTVYEKFLKG